MTPAAKEHLSEFFRSHHDAFVADVLAMVRSNTDAVRPIGRGDIDQMIYGLAAIVREAAGGGATPMADAYLDGVIGAIMAGGDTLENLVGASTTFLAKVVVEASRTLPSETREETLPWLLGFIGGWVARIARVAADAEKARNG